MNDVVPLHFLHRPTCGFGSFGKVRISSDSSPMPSASYPCACTSNQVLNPKGEGHAGPKAKSLYYYYANGRATRCLMEIFMEMIYRRSDSTSTQVTSRD